MERDLLEVRRSTTGWTVTYVSGPSRDRILDLFGIDTLPTAYTARASADVVVASLRERNPQASIVVVD